MTDTGVRFDIDRYFARIGYDGPRDATLDVLRALHRLHPLAIPFENLDPLAGRPVSLALDDVAAKLVDARRGGYCFEHNTLFAHVLMALGFRVTPLSARVLSGRSPGVVTPRSHMLLRVELQEGGWLADVGFGRATLCAPLAFATPEPQTTPLEPARLAQLPDATWKLDVLDGDAWADVYRFEPTPAEWIDYEVANWYTSTSPKSTFTSNLIASIVRDGARATLLNDRYSERDVRGRLTLTRTIAGEDELSGCLRESFGIDVSGFDTLALFARVKGDGAGH